MNCVRGCCQKRRAFRICWGSRRQHQDMNCLFPIRVWRGSLFITRRHWNSSIYFVRMYRRRSTFMGYVGNICRWIYYFVRCKSILYLMSERVLLCSPPYFLASFSKLYRYSIFKIFVFLHKVSNFFLPLSRKSKRRLVATASTHSPKKEYF